MQEIPKTLPIMKKKYNPATDKLTPYEQGIEDAIDLGNTPRASQELLAEVHAVALVSLAKLRGGKRAGSGRKPREHVKTTLLLALDVRAKLEELAKTTGSLSSAVEKAVRLASV
jgi:hypothetical protein